MKIRIMSDLHLEFYPDKIGKSFINSLSSEETDVLVLAGDICLAPQIPVVMKLFCSKFKHVVYVHGNHEFYNSNREFTLTQTNIACNQNKNLYFLDKTVVEIDGQRFVGAPLWFAKSNAPQFGMTDFRVIKGFTNWVYKESDAAVEFFRNELKEGDVAISHHLPSENSVAPEWKENALNPFFVRDIGVIICAKRPICWVHGHTHGSFDYILGESRILCNPAGYLGHKNLKFNPNLIIEIKYGKVSEKVLDYGIKDW